MDSGYKGASMEEMYRGLGPWNYDVPPVHPSKYHAILYELPVDGRRPPKPHVSVQTYHWDDGYVRMPYSNKNLFPSKDEHGKDILISRWELMEQTLLQPILSSRALEAAINTYNTKLPKFVALHHLFEEVLGEEEADHFFKSLLPKIVNLALQLPEILPGSVPLLKADACKSVSFSQQQVASMLANCFLCTFPWRKDVAAAYPGANFVSLFSACSRFDDNVAVEKLKCILHYFRRVLDSPPVGVITFERQHIRKLNMPRWDRIKNNLGDTRIHVSNTGTIEDDGLGLLQVDFANKMIGGGVLGYGCVQEEIRFVICPELIISRLFTEKLGNSEALIIIGPERFSNYKGYGDTFTWAGSFSDNTPFDNSGRRRTSVVAIDAVYFSRPADQFYSSQILRELNKAYTGFYSRCNGIVAPVATGNWGCGAFRGNVQLKFLVQLMACTAASRDMVYYTFGDVELRDDIHNMYTFLCSNNVAIHQLWRILCRFIGSDVTADKFFPFVQQSFFDLKHQPTIKTFFPSKNSPVKATASTSDFQNISPESPTEIADSIRASFSAEGSLNMEGLDSEIFSSQRSLTNAEGLRSFSSEGFDVESAFSNAETKNLKRKRINNSDVLSLIDQIDGEDPLTQTSKECNGDFSFLNTVDEFTRKRNEQKCSESNEQRSEEMDVENLEVNNGDVKKTIEKKKITDYFKKI